MDALGCSNLALYPSECPSTGTETEAETGSATIVMVGVIAVVVTLCAGLAAFARVSTDAERVRLAADQAALAGASVVLGAVRTPSSDLTSPCGAADAAARRNGGELAACRELSTGVQVEVSRVTILGHSVSANARAGLPEPGRVPGAGRAE